MKEFLIVTFILLLSIVMNTSLHAQSFDGNQNDINSILSNIRNFSQFYMALDYDGIANTYAQDAKIMPPGSDVISGKHAIKQQWILPPGVKIPYHKITPIEIKVYEEFAYDLGYYEGRTLRLDGNEISWRGKYLIVWKKEKDQWKIYADAWNRIN